MASPRSGGGPGRALWPSIGFATGDNETRTVTGSTKVHSLWLDFWAPPGVNIAPWGRSPCGNVAHHDRYALHRWRPIIALAGERAQPTAPAERAVFLVSLAGRVVRDGADDTSQRRLRNAVAGGLTRASMRPARPPRRATRTCFSGAQVPGAAVRAGLRRLRGGRHQRREHEPGREPPQRVLAAVTGTAALRGKTPPRRRRRRRADA